MSVIKPWPDIKRACKCVRQRVRKCSRAAMSNGSVIVKLCACMTTLLAIPGTACCCACARVRYYCCCQHVLLQLLLAINLNFVYLIKNVCLCIVLCAILVCFLSCASMPACVCLRFCVRLCVFLCVSLRVFGCL